MNKIARPSAFLVLLLGVVLAGCQKQGPTVAEPRKEPAAKTSPHLIMKEKTQEAGEVDCGIAKVYKFPISNSGDESLRLTVVRKSCSCSEVELPAEGIAPGTEGVVAVHWTPRQGIVGAHT